MKLLSEHICYGGVLKILQHSSKTVGCEMTFSLFLPEQAKTMKIPLVTYLSGLTCTHDNFTTKAGAYKYAAKYGIAIVAPDTSPRGECVPDDTAYDFGQGAGFYINATQSPWASNFVMEDYIVQELNTLICTQFPVQKKQQGIMGHSMGGHGALTLGLKYPTLFTSISAFSPIVAPSQVPWGQKAFLGYLGEWAEIWQQHDACALMYGAKNRSNYSEILIDQGLSDDFLQSQLQPKLFKKACEQVQQKLHLRMQKGYDHSYYFIQSFIEDHIAHHAKHLLGEMTYVN